MDVVLKMLPTNLAWALEVLADIFAIFACSALTFASGKAALASAEQGSLVFKIFIFPEWWLITPASVLFGFLTVECVLRLLRQINSPKTIRSEATSSV
jgi:TRAP-type C4-dicarboxylate transport system permease small subunit